MQKGVCKSVCFRSRYEFFWPQSRGAIAPSPVDPPLVWKQKEIDNCDCES